MNNQKKLSLSIFIICTILTGYKIYTYNRKKRDIKYKNLIPEEEDLEISKKYNFHLIPDDKNNYRSAQLTMGIYPNIIKKYGIKNIIRMNGDGNDSKHKSSFPETTKAQEQEMCSNLGCNYYFINSHEGYKEGLGYTKSLEKVNNILKNGNTLIHCTHGADRTGGMVGGYLKINNIITNEDDLWKYTTQFNSWQDKLNKGKFFGSGYDKYADTFYPIQKLKKSKWVK